MSRLEDELRNALRRESPPAGFVERVLARAAEQQSRWSIVAWVRMRPMRWAVAAGMALLMVGAGIEYQNQREERARGEAARAQVLLALKITGTKLQLAQQKIQELQDMGTAVETPSKGRAQ